MNCKTPSAISIWYCFFEGFFDGTNITWHSSSEDDQLDLHGKW